MTVSLSFFNSSTGSAGGPVSGATVTLTGGLTATGTTDGSGDYSFTIGAGVSATLTVSYGGCSYTQTVTAGSCPSIALCFCSMTTTLTVAGPGSGITVQMGGLTPTYDVFSIPCTNGATTPIGVCSVSGSIYSFHFCSLNLCSVPVVLPVEVSFRASAPGWVDACSNPIYPACGSTNSVSVSLYYWPTCYADYLCGPAPAGFYPYGGGFWACCLPPCVPIASGAGYYPLAIQTRWTSITATPYGGFAPCNSFGPDEGSWITLNLISDTVAGSGAYSVRTLVWSSGCRSGGTYYSALTGGSIVYGSSSVTLTARCLSRYPGLAGQSITLTYNRFQNGGCAPCSGDTCIDCATPGVQGSTSGGSILPLPSGLVCSPVNSTFLSNDYHCKSFGCEFTLDVREPSCTPAQTPVVTTTGTGGGD